MLGVELLAREPALDPRRARAPIESSTSSFRFTIEYALISSPSLMRPSCVRADRQKAGAHTALTEGPGC